MAKSKKTSTRKVSKSTENKVEARPVGEGKDPLAGGERLYNESNTTGETHYKADNSELKAEEKAAENRINGQDADERAEQHNAAQAEAHDVPNEDVSDQDEVAEGRDEEDESK